MTRIGTLCFSPGGTTRRVVAKIASGLDGATPQRFDLTRPDARDRLGQRHTAAASRIDCWIVGVPVYAGRMPAVVCDRLASLDGNERPTIAVVTYGNRDYGVALRQLVETLEAANHRVVAAAAFVGEHSFSSIFPIAVGRPDVSDLRLAESLGRSVAARMSSAPALHAAEIDGHLELLVRMMPDKGPAPVVDMDKCTRCLACVQGCPMDVLHAETMMPRDKQAAHRCIGCVSCVKRCRQEARTFGFPGPIKLLLNRFFRDAMSSRKEPFLMLGGS